VSPDLMVDGEGTRRYLRICGFTEAESEEIIADARADQPSTSTTQDLVITSFRQHAFQDFLRKWPKQWARGRGAPCVEVPGSSRVPAWWLGLAPATLEFWVRFPNERNQGKQAHPVLKYLVPHGSHPPPANSFVIGPAVINTHRAAI